MSIFIDKDTRLVVQGITGRDGGFHTKLMMEYGTNVVAGVTPGPCSAPSMFSCQRSCRLTCSMGRMASRPEWK